MASAVAAEGGGSSSSVLRASFEELEKEQALISGCTLLWKELTDHFSSLERDLQIQSEALQCHLQALDRVTEQSLDALRRRERSIDAAVDLAVARSEQRRDAAIATVRGSAADPPAAAAGEELAVALRALCTTMNFNGFYELLSSKRKEVEIIRHDLPSILSDCVDPARFVLDAISAVFPAGNGKIAGDLGWLSVMILEALVPAVADPDLGPARPLITPGMKARAMEIATAWKDGGGEESAKPSDVHTFLQLVATFGIAGEEREFYRKLVVSSSWRKQMPKLALSLGLRGVMPEIVEELISKGQQLDAVNFAFEAGLESKFPPAPLLKAFLLESRKPVHGNFTEFGGWQRAALRAVIKCVEDRKLAAELPPEALHRRLEQLERAKADKSATANKRTRGGAAAGPMPRRSPAAVTPSPPPLLRLSSGRPPPTAPTTLRPLCTSPRGRRSPPPCTAPPPAGARRPSPATP
ncbi:unnamed protein product [Spirodela intermedia]|uniref:FRIGIDA-like protein n=1 Tax=Spirodela intermedia TaxID=51605 RepID=A0A7I8IKY5_SPIIN|nr:unnamed protein product [Spirodela intermedia]CAA6658555.1 unnamed protein product [Spirodela intermedia]